MYFILSKLLLFLLFPFLWVIALLLIAYFRKNHRKKVRLTVIAIVILYLFSCPALLNLYAKAWNIKSGLPDNGRTYSCAIILGGFSSGDKGGKGYFNTNSNRFIEAIKLFSTGRVSHIMITGGNGDMQPGAFSEAKWVKTQLEALKYPDSCILIESDSRNTIENATFSKPVIKKSGLKPPYILVTSDYHMRRAQMIFTHEGYNVIADPVYTSGNDGFTWGYLIPDATTLGTWNIYIKEAVGYVVNYYKTKP
jgi:uncharacterized SAM-binding protein YcdF (DUF218 family)